MQRFESLHTTVVPETHTPPPQTSPVVQALPSEQAAALLVWTHPVAGLHPSSVQTFESLHAKAAPPTHVPPAQASFVVQAFPSLQGDVLFVWVHPVTGLHPSVVHTLPSSQFGPTPPKHVPPAHVSPVVQALPSSQGAVLLVCVQPVAGLQASSVHTLPSSQLGAGPPRQVPAEQVSLVVQALPSLQGAALLV